MTANSDYQTPYTIVEVDLGTARSTPQEFIGPGALIASIIPLEIPAGLGLVMRLGQNGRDISLEAVPPLSICPEHGNGLYIGGNPASPGQIARIFVGFADGPQGT